MASAQTLRALDSTGSFPARAWLHRLTATDAAAAPAVARVALAAVMFPHGAQHALGWFGGYGFAGTFDWMTGTLGFPAPLAALAIVVELLAPLALLVGLGGRLAALGLFGLMVGAASTHLASGFFMNWFGSLKAGRRGLRVPPAGDGAGGGGGPRRQRRPVAGPPDRPLAATRAAPELLHQQIHEGPHLAGRARAFGVHGVDAQLGAGEAVLQHRLQPARRQVAGDHEPRQHRQPHARQRRLPQHRPAGRGEAPLHRHAVDVLAARVRGSATRRPPSAASRSGSRGPAGRPAPAASPCGAGRPATRTAPCDRGPACAPPGRPASGWRRSGWRRRPPPRPDRSAGRSWSARRARRGAGQVGGHRRRQVVLGEHERGVHPQQAPGRVARAPGRGRPPRPPPPAAGRSAGTAPARPASATACASSGAAGAPSAAAPAPPPAR